MHSLLLYNHILYKDKSFSVKTILDAVRST